VGVTQAQAEHLQRGAVLDEQRRTRPGLGRGVLQHDPEVVGQLVSGRAQPVRGVGLLEPQDIGVAMGCAVGEKQAAVSVVEGCHVVGGQSCRRGSRDVVDEAAERTPDRVVERDGDQAKQVKLADHLRVGKAEQQRLRLPRERVG
jgi:hypothetical protein